MLTCEQVDWINLPSYSILLAVAFAVSTVTSLPIEKNRFSSLKVIVGLQTSGVLSTWQKVACDICLNKNVHQTCTSYIPDNRLFNLTHPAPEQNMGTLIECKPSEREYWTTVGRFKIGDANHEPETGGSSCPSPRRCRPYYNGLGDSARRMCCTFARLLPSASTTSACSDLVNDKAGVFGRHVNCKNCFFKAP